MNVIDANIFIKWFVDGEEHTDKAMKLHRQLSNGELSLIQPLHWKIEVIAVISRIRPEATERVIIVLDALELPVMDDTDVYLKASELSQQLNHHLFDTLYHAVALLSGGIFITDDRKYYRKAQSLGAIKLLSDV